MKTRILVVAVVSGSLAFAAPPATSKSSRGCAKAQAALKQAKKKGRPGAIAAAQRKVDKLC